MVIFLFYLLEEILSNFFVFRRGFGFEFDLGKYLIEGLFCVFLIVLDLG